MGYPSTLGLILDEPDEANEIQDINSYYEKNSKELENQEGKDNQGKGEQ